MPWKFHDDISNGSGVIVWTDKQTYRQTDKVTNGHYWKQYNRRCAGGKICTENILGLLHAFHVEFTVELRMTLHQIGSENNENRQGKLLRIIDCKIWSLTCVYKVWFRFVWLFNAQVNFVFFINIIYALFNKLKAFNTPDSYKYRHR